MSVDTPKEVLFLELPWTRPQKRTTPRPPRCQGSAYAHRVEESKGHVFLLCSKFLGWFCNLIAHSSCSSVCSQTSQNLFVDSSLTSCGRRHAKDPHERHATHHRPPLYSS